MQNQRRNQSWACVASTMEIFFARTPRHFCVEIPTEKNAAGAAARYKPIVYALLEFPCAAIAWQTTSMMSKRILKVAS